MMIRLALLASLATLLAGPAFAQDPVPDTELDQARGGYLMAGGLTFDFGAVVKTYDGGRLALETNVVWTPDGPKVSQEGVSSIGGASFIHNVGGRDLSNLVVNTDSNRDFRQETNVTLVLPGFEGVQSDIGRMLNGIRITDDIAAGAIRSLSD